MTGSMKILAFYFFFPLCFSEEEAYPVEVKQVQPKIVEKSKGRMITCFNTFAAPTYVKKQTNQGRRHTISGHEIHDDKSYRANLRDDLLRSLAQKEIMRTRSMQKTVEEKKAPPEESFNRQKSRRRSSLVTDVVTAATPPNQHKTEQRRSSLVCDVIKFESKVNNSGGSLVRYQANVSTSIPSKLEILKARTTGDSPIPSNRETRMKEIAKLKYTSAAKAAKLAFQEAHLSMKTNRRLSILCPAHHSIIPGVEKLPDFYSMNMKNVDKNMSAKFKSWQKKFKIGLTANKSEL